MIRHRFSITIIEDETNKCTKVFHSVSTSKVGFIGDYLEALNVYHKRPKTTEEVEVKETVESAQEALL